MGEHVARALSRPLVQLAAATGQAFLVPMWATQSGSRLPRLAKPQTFLGHASAVVTLRTYAHLWPGDEDRTGACSTPRSARMEPERTEAASEE